MSDAEWSAVQHSLVALCAIGQLLLDLGQQLQQLLLRRFLAIHHLGLLRWRLEALELVGLGEADQLQLYG